MAKLQKKLIDRLTRIGIECVEYPDRDDGFCGLRFEGSEFAHFHDFNELDLKLSKNLIRQEGLSHPKDSKLHPNRSKNSAWIELRFTRTFDLDPIVRLIELAIAKN